MAIDPVCNMEVDEATAKYKSENKGETFYFCAHACKEEFGSNPKKYAKGKKE